MFKDWFGPANGRKYSFLTTWVAGPLALFIIVIVVPAMPESIRASQNEGIHGTFTTMRADCGGRGGCTYYGTFVSDDETVTLDDVFIDGGVDEVGEIVKAQSFTDAQFDDKVYELNSHDWLWALSILLAAVLYFSWWFWAIVIRRLRPGTPEQPAGRIT